MADLTLPDTAHIGDPDHDVDHNLIVQALIDLNAQGPATALATASTWKWLTAAQSGSVATGRVGVDHDTPGSATALHMAAVDNDGFDRSGLLANLRAGDTVFLWQKSDMDSNVRYTVTGAPTDNTTWFAVPVLAVAGGGTEPGNNEVVVATFLYGGGGTGAPADDVSAILASRMFG
jgi:hypothetical protein